MHRKNYGQAARAFADGGEQLSKRAAGVTLAGLCSVEHEVSSWCQAHLVCETGRAQAVNVRQQSVDHRVADEEDMRSSRTPACRRRCAFATSRWW